MNGFCKSKKNSRRCRDLPILSIDHVVVHKKIGTKVKAKQVCKQNMRRLGVCRSAAAASSMQHGRE
jgi:hypothetical protein